tara:strand:- start:11873 stop:12133 length:261 start_codon:yes stop_codon:yes gene_type:complete
MGSLATRLGKLETSETITSPAVKQWLGWELTDADKAGLDNQLGVDPDFDTMDLSATAREWLAVAPLKADAVVTKQCGDDWLLPSLS